MDRAVADRVERDRHPPAAALGQRMVPFDAMTERAAAQPAALAGRRIGVVQSLRSQWFTFAVAKPRSGA
ncbi:hypothetical protein ACFB49_38450 [Sphingomonas sp. DBB INV C78]